MGCRRIGVDAAYRRPRSGGPSHRHPTVRRAFHFAAVSMHALILRIAVVGQARALLELPPRSVLRYCAGVATPSADDVFGRSDELLLLVWIPDASALDYAAKTVSSPSSEGDGGTSVAQSPTRWPRHQARRAADPGELAMPRCHDAPAARRGRTGDAQAKQTRPTSTREQGATAAEGAGRNHAASRGSR